MKIPLLITAFVLAAALCGGARASPPTSAPTSPPAAGSPAPGTTAPSAGPAGAQDPPTLAGCQILPDDNIWNARVDNLPVHPRSAEYVETIGSGEHVHADFGSGVWPPESTSPIGIPYNVVPGNQAPAEIHWTHWPEESDDGPYPVPPDALIEGGPDADGDRHVLVLDKDNCVLYELFYAWPRDDGGWDAANGAIYDLGSNALRPDGWTPADAAGLPILPGLVRYEEVEAGAINHALRFTAPETQSAHVWPARHDASDNTGLHYPPMGQRFRLKADFDISGFSPEVQVLLTALKQYGMILADNGSPWYISGVPDERWDNDVLHELHQVDGSNFEAVFTDVLKVHPDSGQAAAPRAVLLPFVLR